MQNVNPDSSWFEELPLQTESPRVGQTLGFLSYQCSLKETDFLFLSSSYRKASAYVSILSPSDDQVGPGVVEAVSSRPELWGDSSLTLLKGGWI